MDFKLKIKNFIEQLRALPDKQKKIILWAIVIILGLIMAFFWFRATMDKLSNIGDNIKDIQIPSFEDSDGNIIDYDVEGDFESILNQ